MELPKTCINKRNSGFTVLEVMVVMGLLAAIGSLSLFMGMESFRGGSFRNDRDMVVDSLRRARSMAINSVCSGSGCGDGKSHGVHFDPDKKGIILFQCDNYDAIDSSNEAIPFDNKTVYIDASSSVDIIFERLSGNSTTTNVILKDSANHISTIGINSAGRVDWQ